MLAGVLGLVTAGAFEATAVVSVMPVVAAGLGAVRHYGLIFSLFMTANLLGTVLAGPWCDRRGPRWPTTWGCILFAAGLVLCGAAGSLWAMLLGRLVSGLGAGLFTVALYVVLARAYPEAERPRVFGYLSAAWIVPGLVGPALAGWVTENASWRLVFLTFPPLAVVALAMLGPALVGMTPRQGAVTGGWGSRRLVAGLGLSAGLGLVQWFSQDLVGRPRSWLAVAAGVALVIPSARILLPAGVGRLARGLAAVVASRGLLAGCFFAGETFVPLALVQLRGLSVFHAGLTLSLASIAWALASWVQGCLRPRAQDAIWVGAAAIAAALGGTAVVMATGLSGWWVLVTWSLCGFGMGLAIPAQATAVLLLAESGQEGEATGGTAAFRRDGIRPRSGDHRGRVRHGARPTVATPPCSRQCGRSPPASRSSPPWWAGFGSLPPSGPLGRSDDPRLQQVVNRYQPDSLCNKPYTCLPLCSCRNTLHSDAQCAVDHT